ncbi:MAG TPA: CoA transferase, partial [Myxococcota bacterium]|nr:CoA transferase [Myxococcota bacterium]
DFGARVIDVEPPEGHATRALPPFARDDATASGLHALLSPNKQSAVAASEAELLRWVAAADVVLDWEPARVDAARLRAAAPRAILASLSWYGLTGPLAGLPANDAAICAQIGWVKGIGEPGGMPLLPSGHPISVLGGVTAFIAVAAELLGRELGNGRPAARVDVSLLEAAMCITEVAPIAFFNGSNLLARLGRNRFPPNYPAGIFATRDGWIGVTALTPRQWRDLCELLGVPELGRDPRHQVGLQRLADADALDARLAPIFRERSAEEWLLAGQARRIPLAPVPTPAELLASEQLEARGSLREIALPSGRTLRAPGPPFRLVSAPLAEVARGAPTPRKPLREPERRPSLLRGVRILDLTMGWAGPLAARHLADLGAEVVKIESRRRFDWWRGWELTAAFLEGRGFEKSPAHNMVNRNKLGVTLDLTDPRGAELFERLVVQSDALIENYSAGVMEKLGFGDRRLHELNPRLVIVTMPPFGRGGPWHDFRAYGSTVEHASGLPHLNGAEGEPPTMLHIALGDPIAGVHGAAALALALLQQRRTGAGQVVDLSQTEALMSLGVHGLAHQLVRGEPPPRLGNAHPGFAPHGCYACRGEDQWFTLSVETDAQWRAFRALVAAPELLAPELESASARCAARNRIDARVAAWALARDRDEIVAALQSRGIPAAGVLDVNEVLTHPQLEARGFWQWIERDVVGVQPHPSAPHRTSESPHAIDFPAPTLGRDTRDVLHRSLGLSLAELDELEREGVIGTVPIVSAGD